jgi:hypothetical protein
MSIVPADLQARLRRAAERREQHREIAGRLAAMDAQLLRARQLSARWRREAGRAAERLEELSGFRPLALLRGLFRKDHGVRAALAEKLDHARSEHDAVDRLIPELEAQRSEVAAELAVQEHAPATYAQVLREKETWLRERAEQASPDQPDAKYASLLQESAGHIADLDASVAALRRFVGYGRQAEGSLLVAKQGLQQARSAGRMDIAGLGVMAGRSTHRFFDEAKVHLRCAERYLNDMSAEMQKHSAELRRIELSAGLTLASLVFDSLAVDLCVQNKIVIAIEDVDLVLERVRQTVWSAEKGHTDASKLLLVARDERDRWIEQAD